MKIREKIKAQKVAVLSILTAFSFLTLYGSIMTTGASQEGRPQRRGRQTDAQQLYDFGAQPGQTTLTTDGIELADMGVPFQRAIIGGTGAYALARGEATQTLLLFPNQAGGVNLRLNLKVRGR